ncbi:hypothetical protein MMC06_003275 [Schaereria dolodes]|nr:hypothetical protein [Schaereria dolodes]
MSMDATSLGPPLGPTHFYGAYVPSNLYPQPLPTNSGYPYRIHKHAQRSGSIADPQAVAKAIEANQMFIATTSAEPISTSYFNPTQNEYQAYETKREDPDLQARVTFQHQSHGVSTTLLPESTLVTVNAGLEKRADEPEQLRPTILSTNLEIRTKQSSNSVPSTSEVGKLGQKSESTSACSLESPASSQKGARKSCCHGRQEMPRSVSPGNAPTERVISLNENRAQPTYADGNHSATTQVHPLAYDTTMEIDKTSNEQSYNNFIYPMLDQTALYTYPANYATASNPMNPALMAALHQNPYTYSQIIPQYAPYGLIGSAAPSAEGSTINNPPHNCKCGPECDCLFCAAHPYNTRTRTCVQNLGEILASGSDDSQMYSRPPTSYQNQLDPTGNLQQVRPEVNPASIGNMPSPTESAKQESNGTPNSSIEFHQFGPTFNGDHGVQQTYDSRGYYTIEYPIDQRSTFPGCTDFSGTCQCGSQCPCVGCLTHTGHDSIPMPFEQVLTEEVLSHPNNITEQSVVQHGMSLDPSCYG